MSKPKPAAAPAATGAAPSKGKKKILVLLIVLGIVGTEWAAAYFLLPGAPETQAADAAEQGADAGAGDDAAEGTDESGAEHSGHDKKAGHGEKGEEKPKKPKSDSEEVDLGEFTITSYQPTSSTTMFINFRLYGTILRKQTAEFNERLEASKNRVRDNIITIVRSAEVADLTDAGLGLIKRKILETTNKTLGKPLLKEVVFSDFSYVEQ